ncbi:hypothetical protein TNCV_4056611 [Trichonephila clavipes]|nr:hypothetical protein TNCV_4056611 [Trichonephila clavipes]
MPNAHDQSPSLPIDVLGISLQPVEAWRVGCHLSSPPRHSTGVSNDTVCMCVELVTAYNREQAATSAYVFMIQSLFSPLKEIVHIMPVKKIDGEKLFAVIKKKLSYNLMVLDSKL